MGWLLLSDAIVWCCWCANEGCTLRSLIKPFLGEGFRTTHKTLYAQRVRMHTEQA